MGNEYQWADALRKAQMNAQTRQSPLSSSSAPKISFEQLQEQLDYYKEKLPGVVKNKDQNEIQNLLERLINTHARMTALLIRKEKELGKQDNSPSIKAHLEKYFSDCNSLLQQFPS